MATSCQTYPQSLGLYDEDLRDAGCRGPGSLWNPSFQKPRVYGNHWNGLHQLADLFEKLGGVNFECVHIFGSMSGSI